jgi:phosphotransferase system enzyme I (PtsP)
VAFRTFDHGGDKTPATLAGVREANPALGWRALRIALDRPETLRSQLYALAVAAAGEQLDVMFPMAAEAAEIAQARAILRGALEQAASDGLAPRKVRVGVAIETPSLVWQGATALRRVDFATVGTNDLLQFTFAADRDGVRMAERYDSVSPPALAMLRHVVQAAAKANAPGAENLIRDLEASVDASEAALLVDELIESEEHSVRDQVREFAEAAGLTFDDGY